MAISIGISAAEQEQKRKANENNEEARMLYHKELISEEDKNKRIKDSSKIINGSDLDITREYLSKKEFLELQKVLANALELGIIINDWTILKPQLNNDQIKIIGEKVIHEEIHNALEELKNFLKMSFQEFDLDLFGDSNNKTNQTNNTETVEIDYLDKDNYELGAKESWNCKFFLCERADSVIDNTSNKRVSKEILQSFPKLLMPGLLSSHFYLQVVLIVYISAGFYVSTDLAKLKIPIDYYELDKILKVFLYIEATKKNDLRYKIIKKRAEKEKFLNDKRLMNEHAEYPSSWKKKQKQKKKKRQLRGFNVYNICLSFYRMLWIFNICRMI
ncbi:hypothetical protein C1645_814027 [Glomus cerebriforme]|uniref:Uncharacterized protein n=1 Tax=Glomus cerebriforme TaxID=658196 RepID=A0A397THQ3_9GLOM|nr:hypothetical protein C1645_814027 [Glomus cerebriforme]